MPVKNRHSKQQVPLSKAAADAQEMPVERVCNAWSKFNPFCMFSNILSTEVRNFYVCGESPVWERMAGCDLKFNSQLLLIKLFWINLLCLHMHIRRFPSNCGIIFWRERKGFIAWRYCCIPDKEIANVFFSSHSSWISSFLSSTLSSLSWMFQLMFPAVLFWSDLRICSPCFSSFCLWYFWH